MSTHNTTINNAVSTHDTDIKNAVSTHDTDIKQELTDIKNLLGNLQGSVDANFAALLEVVRLLHTPSGMRESDLPACDGEACVWSRR